MKDELFAELVASLKEGGSILRGEKEASRTFHLERLDIKRIREGYDLNSEAVCGYVGNQHTDVEELGARPARTRRAGHGAAARG